MIAAVRVRGVPDTGKKVSDTLNSLRLHNKNNCVILQDTESNLGMLRRADNHVAYGDVSTDTVENLLSIRGKVHGNTVEDEVDELGYSGLDGLVEALEERKVTFAKLHSMGLELPFRLSPPSKGWKNPKKQYSNGGSTGKRDDMDELLERMI